MLAVSCSHTQQTVGCRTGQLYEVRAASFTLVQPEGWTIRVILVQTTNAALLKDPYMFHNFAEQLYSKVLKCLSQSEPGAHTTPAQGTRVSTTRV